MNAFGAGERLTSASPMDAERGDPGETLGAADLGQPVRRANPLPSRSLKPTDKGIVKAKGS